MTAYARAQGGRRNRPVHILLPGGTRTACGLDATTMTRWPAAGSASLPAPLCPACRQEISA